MPEGTLFLWKPLHKQSEFVLERRVVMDAIGISSGIALGKVHIYKEPEINVVKQRAVNTDYEIERLEKAIKKGIEEIDEIYDNALRTLGEKESKIFSVHRMMMEDPVFIEDIKRNIRENCVNAEWAVEEISNYYISSFQDIEDEYLRERIWDLKDVSKRILKILLGVEKWSFKSLREECIIVARDLAPSDTAKINKEMVLGIVTELGGKTSHTSIIAKNLEIPAVTGVKNATDIVKDGDLIIVDGTKGLVFLNPCEKVIRLYEQKKKDYEKFSLKLKQSKNRKNISKDGVKVKITANIDTPKDIKLILDNGGDGVGLYRTEFLYMNRATPPTEQEQFEAYKIVAQSLEDRSVVIRTLDVGGDKGISYLNLPEEMNPFLGFRGIRFCLKKIDIFKTQLRALLRASAFGKIKIMFPMISSINEIRAAKKILEEAKMELRSSNIKFNEGIQVGIMVEIPSVAIHSHIFAKEVDFFSIGTNDLIQYSLAVDRGNQDISNLYNQYHPAVLNLVNMTIKNGHKEGIEVGMCGESAADDKLIPILLGMGLDEFSMNPHFIPRIRYIINNTEKRKMKGIVDTVLNLSTAEEVEGFIDENIVKYF